MIHKCYNEACDKYAPAWVMNCSSMTVKLKDCEHFVKAPIVSEFDMVVEARCEKINKVLVAKAKEYAQGQNRFHNFDVAARIHDTTPEQALLGMMSKHLVSVIDLINDPECATEYLVDEKVGDTVNYLILLEGLLLRRLRSAEESRRCDE